MIHRRELNIGQLSPIPKELGPTTQDPRVKTSSRVRCRWSWDMLLLYWLSNL